MDNLTHSLVGALLGQTGLKRKTGLAMPALIIGANLPDVDAACFFWVEGTEHLGIRRGITHGPIAMLLLPLVLATLLYGWDRGQAKRRKRPDARLPVSFGWLYVLALIGCLSHPALDWLNSYGIRLLEPFSSQWFYGDILFIIDLWLWIGLGFATWLSLRREKKSGGDWQLPARIALSAMLAYIGINSAITWTSEERAKLAEPYPTVAIATHVPVKFWEREMVTGNGDGVWMVGATRHGDVPLSDCNLTKARADDPGIDAFLFWSRTPFVERTPAGQWLLRDARFTARAAGFTVALPDGICPKAIADRRSVRV